MLALLHRGSTKLRVQKQHILQKKTLFLVGKDRVPESLSKNLINRKRTNFWIEAIPQKKSQLRKKNWGRKKSELFLKSEKFSMKNHMIFIDNFPDFGKFQKFSDFQTFSKYFFRDLKKIGVEIFWGYSFDAEICPLSIYEVFRVIPAALDPCQLEKVSFFVKYVVWGPSQLPTWWILCAIAPVQAHSSCGG